MRNWIFGFMLLCSGAGTLHGQTESTPEIVSVLRRANADRWHVKVLSLGADSSIQGQLRLRNGSISVDGVALDPASIRTLERRTQNGYGAVVGGIVGALLFGAVGTGVSGLGDVADTGNNVLVVASFSSVGALLGMFAGHAISPGATRWEPVWPQAR